MRFVNHLLTLDISSTDSLLSLISLVIIISFYFSFPNYIYVSNDDQPTKSHLSRAHVSRAYLSLSKFDYSKRSNNTFSTAIKKSQAYDELATAICCFELVRIRVCVCVQLRTYVYVIRDDKDELRRILSSRNRRRQKGH